MSSVDLGREEVSKVILIRDYSIDVLLLSRYRRWSMLANIGADWVVKVIDVGSSFLRGPGKSWRRWLAWRASRVCRLTIEIDR